MASFLIEGLLLELRDLLRLLELFFEIKDDCSTSSLTCFIEVVGDIGATFSVSIVTEGLLDPLVLLDLVRSLRLFFEVIDCSSSSSLEGFGEVVGDIGDIFSASLFIQRLLLVLELLDLVLLVLFVLLVLLDLVLLELEFLVVLLELALLELVLFVLVLLVLELLELFFELTEPSSSLNRLDEAIGDIFSASFFLRDFLLVLFFELINSDRCATLVNSFLIRGRYIVDGMYCMSRLEVKNWEDYGGLLWNDLEVVSLFIVRVAFEFVEKAEIRRRKKKKDHEIRKRG